jgi:TetR/AcrR family transcriptional regulator
MLSDADGPSTLDQSSPRLGAFQFVRHSSRFARHGLRTTQRTSLTNRPKATRKRAQGRPNEGKNSVGPASLLRAARELLENLPPAQVTRAELARHAGVDPNLIRYYFKDRDSLLLAVVDEIVEEESKIAARATAGGTPVERLRAQIRHSLEFHQRHPYFHRLLIEEIATWKSQRARQLFHRLNHATIDLYAGIFRDGSKAKSLRALDPVLVHIAVIGMCEFFMSSKLLLEDALGKSADPMKHARRYADTVVQFLVDGARARAHTGQR